MKKKQTKSKHGNGKQIALVVIVLFLIVAITAALLWLSDLGTNWNVKAWGDKFSKQEQTKPGNSGSNKPIIPVIPEPALYDEVKVGDEIKAMYIDTDYVITDEDIARFKSEGKAVEEDGFMYYYLIYEKYREYFPFGLCYTEINKSMIVAQIGGEELSSEDISDDFTIHALTFSYEGWGGFIFAEKVGYISDELFNSLFGDEPIQFGWGATEYVCFPRSINVQEVRCADILRKFVYIKSEAEYEQNQ